eukprot:1158197-Pelagomonas_calceolata.AAC.10
MDCCCSLRRELLVSLLLQQWQVIPCLIVDHFNYFSESKFVSSFICGTLDWLADAYRPWTLVPDSSLYKYLWKSRCVRTLLHMTVTWKMLSVCIHATNLSFSEQVEQVALHFWRWITVGRYLHRLVQYLHPI